MPDPIDVLLDPTMHIVLSLYAMLFVCERIAPGRTLAPMPGWALKGVAAFMLFLTISVYLPLLWGDALAPLQIADLSDWPTAMAVATAVLAYEFGAYAYHRAMHRFTPLWRTLHQMHHSAERLDVSSAFWFSPLDMIGWTVLPSLVFALIGMPPQAVTVTVLFTTFLGIFQHANLNTPVWLGYLIQRPESHSVHHQRGVHRYNYADLPLVDMLFGTFHNPRAHAPQTGFWHGASSRVLDMLMGRDVSRPQ